ncbi:MAG: hypothetical protein KDB27_24605 [Planctomycetales bacterium]|nr:hypothetical protein [Planctomycetales bacterium]
MKQFLGFFLLVIAAALVAGYTYFKRADEANVVTLTGVCGSEKIAFLQNPKVVDILKSKYDIVIEVSKKGSVDMVLNPPAGQDFLWPAGQINVDMFEQNGGVSKGVDSIFHSPIVFYSWNIVVDQIMAHQQQDPDLDLLSHSGGAYYLKNSSRFFQMILDGKEWKELGVDKLFGKVVIKSTDPRESNSGNMFAALLANSLNDNNVLTSEHFDEIKDKIKSVFLRQGYMEGSSGVLFEQFLSLGAGANPIIVGYENQLIEFSIQNKESLATIRDQLRIVYPQPTVWASHPLIALTDNGKRLLEALKDEQIQKLAWEEHGFRSGGIKSQNDPSVLAINGLPKSITSVMNTPSADIMTRIVDSLSN